MAAVDRIALGLFVLVALGMFFLGGIGPNDKFMDADWWQAYFHIMFMVGLKLVVPAWLVLRLGDAMTGGPARRRGVFTVRPLN